MPKFDMEMPDGQSQDGPDWIVDEWEEEDGRRGMVLSHRSGVGTAVYPSDLGPIALACLRVLPAADRLKALLQVEEVRALIGAAQEGENCAHDLDFFSDRPGLSQAGERAYKRIHDILAPWLEVMR